jgi:hypothetical protein
VTRAAESRNIPLTVVIATTQPWPELKMCLDSLHDQAAAAGAELLVVDGHGRGLPDGVLDRYPRVTRIERSGASVLQMRAFAMAQASGEVVAVTEDHCRVAPDWCRRIIEAHHKFPDAAVVGGVVENGASQRIVDWASFFIVNGASMPPVRNGAHRKVALQASVSYKRRAVPREVPRLGRMEWMLNRELRRRGETLVSDDRIVVDHIQSLTFGQTCAIHYHDSRCIAAFRLEHIGLPERLVRLGACFAMPPLLFWRTVLPILAKRRHLRWLLLSLPMLGILVHCRAAGALVGFLAGAGRSPLHIR